MRMLVIGASGFVGSYVMDHFKKEHHVVGTYLSNAKPGLVKMDMSNRSDVLRVISEVNPGVVLLPAAKPNVEWCEDHADESYQANVVGIKNVVDAVKVCGAKLVYYSTEYVFDGVSGPYGESDAPNPLSVYAKHKYEAEQYVVAQLPSALVLRTTVVFGWESTGKNFVDRFVHVLREGKTFNLPADQISSPTYVHALVEETEALLKCDCKGIYNAVGPEVMDRYAFGMLICEVFGLDKSLAIKRTTDELGQKAPRPLRAGLRIDKLIKDTGYSPRSVRECLMDMMLHERK